MDVTSLNLFILLFILVHCEDMFEEQSNKVIVLAKTKEDLTSTLQNIVSNFVIISKNTDVKSTIDIVRSHPNNIIINLHTHDFYNNDYNDILQNNLVYAGDIPGPAGTTEVIVNSSIIKIPVNKIAKLMTANIERNRRLQQFVFDYPNIKLNENVVKKPNTVVICLNKYNKFVKNTLNFNKLEFDLKYIDDCEVNTRQLETFKENVLAVLTPGHLTLENFISTPILIYEDYEDNDGNAFNVINEDTSMHAFELGIKKFLKITSWSRVAIISDGWPYSQKFQQRLTSMLTKEDIRYTVQECLENIHGVVDFRPALRTLLKAYARIIIVNVNKRNGLQLARQVQYMKMYNNIIWIVRWPFAEDVSPILGTVISLSLSPYDKLNHANPNRHGSTDAAEYRITSIVHLITRVYQNNEFVNQLDFKRQLKKNLKYYTQETVLYITKATGYSRTLGKIWIRGNTVFEESFLDLGMYQDDTQWCFRSNDYFNPCNNAEFMYIMVVLVVFALAVLIIVLINYKINESMLNYQRMN